MKFNRLPSRCLSFILPLIGTIPSNAFLFYLAASVQAQSITPAADGTGTIVNTNGNQLDITGGSFSGDRTNLFHSFDKFNLSPQQTATFLANPQLRNILGRIVGGDASLINGLIQITGGNPNLFLMNPAGIVFGPNARLDVPGNFNATTANGILFGNDWFNAAGFNDYSKIVGSPSAFAFTMAQPGTIINAGNLSVASGNSLNFIAGGVVNTGQLSAPSGQVTLTAVPGQNVVKMSLPGHLLSLEVQPLAANSNQPHNWTLPIHSLPDLLTTGSGGYNLGATVNPDGSVKLSVADVNVPTNAGVAIASGTIDVSGNQGGTVGVFGQKVGVVGAQINASGTNGGGTVLIGGDFQGKGNVPNANVSYVSPNSTIKADAALNGNGGKVIVWADQTTRFHGAISAQGGVQGGNGGFAEVSGKENLIYRGNTNLIAPQGQTGTLLLDPKNIVIDTVNGNGNGNGGNGNGNGNGSGNNNSVPIPDNDEFNENPTGDVTFNAGDIKIELDKANLTLQANNNITVNSSINTSDNTNSFKLTLEAGKSVIMNNAINLKGDFVAIANSSGATQAYREDGDGSIQINSNITTTGSQTYNGAVSLTNNPILTSTDNAINFNSTTDGSSNLTINAGTGAVNFTGAVGNTTALTDLNINSTGATTFASIVNATNLTTSTGSTTTVQGDVTTSSTQSYGGALQVVGDVTLTGDEINFATNVSGTGNLRLQATADKAIAIGGTTDNTGTLDLTAAEIGYLQDGFSSITIGSTGTGDITLAGSVTFKDPVKIGSFNTSSITATNPITGTDNAAIALQAAGNIITGNIITSGQDISLNSTSGNISVGQTISASGSGTNGNISFTGNVILTQLDTNITTSGSGNVTFNNAINSNSGQTNNLKVTAGTGEIAFKAEVGNTTALGKLEVTSANKTTFSSNVTAASLTTNGKTEINGNITTSSSTEGQSYNGQVAIGSNVILKTDAIKFADIVSGIGQQLTLQTYTDNKAITIGGASTDYLSGAAVNLLQDGFSAIQIVANSNITLANNLSFKDPVRIAATGSNSTITTQGVLTGSDDATITLEAGGNITTGGNIVNFGRAINITSANGSIDTKAGELNTSSILSDGGAIALSAKTGITTGKIDSSSTATAGAISLDAGTGNVTLGGNISAFGQVGSDISFSSNVILTQLLTNINTSGSNSSGNILFSNQLNGTNAGSQNLTLNAGTGNITFINPVGNTTRLGNLTITNAGNVTTNAINATRINIAASNTIETQGALNTNSGGITGAIAFNSPTIKIGGNIDTSTASLLNNSVTFTGNVSLTQASTTITTINTIFPLFGGSVTFNNLDGTTPAANALTIDAGSGIVTFAGAVGNSVELGDLTVKTTNTTTFSNTVKAASLTTNGGGNTVLGGDVTTSGKGQNYQGQLVLGNNRTLTGDEIDFTQSVFGTGTLTLQTYTDNQAIAIGNPQINSTISVLDITAEELALLPALTSINIGKSTGAGTVTLYPGATNAPAAIKIVGGATLAGANQATNWQITSNNAGSVSGFTNGITFTNIENLKGGNNSDTFKAINGATVSGTIDGGDGSDTIDYSDPSAPLTVNLGSLEGISIENVIGKSGSTLIGTNTNNTWYINASNSGVLVNGNLPSDIHSFTNFDNLIGGSLTDKFVFQYLGSTIVGTIDGGDTNNTNTIEYLGTQETTINLATSAATKTGGFSRIQSFVGSNSGNNSLIAANVDNTWTINGTDAGSIGSFSFSKFQNLTGGTANDTFAFSGAGIVSGLVDGREGTNNQINFFNYTSNTPVTVNLSENKATDNIGTLITKFINIQDTVGSASDNDTLIAGDTGIIWNISDTGNSATGTINFSSFENLKGGNGSDTYNVSNYSGDLILDGGNGSDTYNITFKGSGNSNIAVKDSGTIGSNNLNIYGTSDNDAIALTTDQSTTPITRQITRENETVTYTNAISNLAIDTGIGVDQISINNSLTLLGNLALKTTTDGSDITANAAIAVANLDINGNTINLNANVTTNGGKIAITSTSGSIDTSAATLNTSSSSGSGGAIAINSTNGSIKVGSINSRTSSSNTTTKGGLVTLNAGTSDITLNGDINTAATTGSGNSLDFTGNVILAQAITITTSGNTASGNVTFNNAVDGTQNLTLNTGAGDITFKSAVGSQTQLANLITNSTGNTNFNSSVNAASLTTNAGGTTNLQGDVTTTGVQTYGDAVTIANNPTLTGNGITFSNTLDGNSNLTANAGSGNLTFTGAVGSKSSLVDLIANSTGTTNFNSSVNAASLVTDADGTTNLKGNVTTTGAQIYGDAVTIANNPILTGNGITFSSSLDGNSNFTANVGSSNLTFTGAVGSSSALGSLIANSTGITNFNSSVNAASLVTNAGGTTNLQGNVTTTGAQTYGDAVTITNNPTLTGNGITFSSSLDGNSNLTANAGSGNLTFTGAIGNSANLSNLIANSTGTTNFNSSVNAVSLVTNAGGTTNIQGNVTTTGAQIYGDAVTIANNPTLTGNGITFSSSLDGNSNLIANAGNSDLTFNGAVGSNTALATLNASTDNANQILINGSNITTTGDQTYNNAVSLNASSNNTTITGNNITFKSTVRSATDGEESLTITSKGTTNIQAAVGDNNQRLANFTSNGITAITGASVATTGSQTYNNSVTLGANSALTTDADSNGAGDFVFNGSLFNTNGNSLTITAADVKLNGVLDVGAANLIFKPSTTSSIGIGNGVNGNFNLSTTELTTNLNSSGNVTIGRDDNTGTINIASANNPLDLRGENYNLIIAGQGNFNLNNNFLTTGDQTYNNPVILQANVILQGNNIVFGNTVNAALDGQQSLTVNSNGITTFSNNVGGINKLSSLTTNSRETQINTNTVRTTGSQTYNNSVTIGANLTLESSNNSDITFNSSINSDPTARNLTINTGGVTSFNGLVGNNSQLSSLTTDANGKTVINTTQIKTDNSQNYNDKVTLGNDVVIESLNNGDINLNNTVDSDSTPRNLTINTSGVTRFGNTLGATKNLNSVTTDAGGSTEISNNVTTSGAAGQNYNDIVSFKNNAILTGDELNFGNKISGVGTNLTLQPFTATQAIALGGIDSGSFNLTSAEIDFLQDGFNLITIGRENGSGAIIMNGDVTFKDPVLLRSPVDSGSINLASGTLTGTDNSSITLAANQNITTANITTQGQAIKITSTNGAIATGILNSSATTGNGGDVTLNAYNNITTGNIDASAPIGKAGNISLTTTDRKISVDSLTSADLANGIITTGNINASGAIGGNTTIKPFSSLAAGQINTSATSGDAGNVVLGRNNQSIQFDFINAESRVGKGGDVSVSTVVYLIAKDTFIAADNLRASISTIGVTSGAISITHGSSVLQIGSIPLDIKRGGITGSGTAGAITNGLTSLNNTKITGNYDATKLTIRSVEPPPNFPKTTLLSGGMPLLQQAVSSEVTKGVDAKASSDYAKIGLNFKVLSDAEIQTRLQNIAKIPGLNPGLIYALFVPKNNKPTLLGDLPTDQLQLTLMTSNGEKIIINTGVTRDEIYNHRNRFFRHITDRDRAIRHSQSYLEYGQQLYKWIIAPIRQKLQAQNINNLTFVMDAGLRSLPIAALHDGKEFVLNNYSVGFMPSFSSTETDDSKFGAMKDAQVLALGASEFADQASLPAVPLELSAITKIWKGQSLLDKDFNLEAFKKARAASKDFRIIHLATHGEFKSGELKNSYIQFGNQKLTLDQVGEQLSLKNPSVDLMVLSACRTALGDKDAELGFAGLAVKAGVKSALASLWYVNDAGTLALMTGFYKHLRATPIKAKALQLAQLDMLQGKVRLENGYLVYDQERIQLPEEIAGLGDMDFSHPYYWSAFSLVGNPW